MAGGRKIVGLAQVKRRTGVLIAAGLLLGRTDWETLCTAIGKPAVDAALLAARTTSCAEELGWEPPLPHLACHLRRQLHEAVSYPESRLVDIEERISFDEASPAVIA